MARFTKRGGATKKAVYGQIAIYPDVKIRKRIETEAKEKKWKLGPTVLEIVRQFFAKKDADAAQS